MTPPSLACPSILSLAQSILGAWMPIWGCSQRNTLSCAFQETAVYGEHIWFETNVSGDFCYVGEQNCMAKLLVSQKGSRASPAGAADAGCAATRRGHHEGPAAAAGASVGICQGRECAPPVSNFCRCWCSVCNGNLAQGCRSLRGGMVIFQGQAVGISHP